VISCPSVNLQEFYVNYTIPTIGSTFPDCCYVFYLFEFIILAFMVYGAMHDRIELPTKKSGNLIINGWAAWLVCLFPLGFVGLIYFRFDPSSVRFSRSTRLIGSLLSVFGGFAALVAAALLGPG
jgi:hypothetical protein